MEQKLFSLKGEHPMISSAVANYENLKNQINEIQQRTRHLTILHRRLQHFNNINYSERKANMLVTMAKCLETRKAKMQVLKIRMIVILYFIRFVRSRQ